VGIKDTKFYAAFRRIRDRYKARFRRVRRKVDAHTGGRALQQASLAAVVSNDTATLKALVYLVERAQADDAHRREWRERLEDRVAAIDAALGQLDERLRAALPPVAPELAPPVVQRLVETDASALVNPEGDLLAHLAPLLASRCALDVGANEGEVSQVLIDAGLEVIAFEPNPPVLAALRARLGGRPGFRARHEAVGDSDGERDLHLAADRSTDGRWRDPARFASLVPHAMPADLPFERSVRVPVRSLDSLRRGREIPDDVGLLKVDTEGLDLEVLQGMGALRPQVVMAEFWDETIPFGGLPATNRLDALVAEMRRRGYGEHVVIFRRWGEGEAAFYCHLSQSVEGSWGNVLFFREPALFAAAQRWCTAALPVAVFRAAPPRSAAADPIALAEVRAAVGRRLNPHG
jgi:FkbM family methyltransferase